MKGTSKVIMGATLVMVVSLAIVIGLVLVLLAELYCSLLLRRRQLRTTTSGVAVASTMASSSRESQHQSASAPSLGSFYAQGVLLAPRSFLFPAVSGKNKADVENQHSHPPQTLEESQTQKPISTSHQASFLSTSPPSPRPVQKIPFQGAAAAAATTTSTSNGVYGDGSRKHFVYISNPIYDNEESERPKGENTPFETPDTSPSRLEMGGSSGDDDGSNQSSPSITPPLTPMKKLPAEACSVSLRDARSLGTSGSDSNSNNGGSSSSSGSPCTSPSW